MENPAVVSQIPKNLRKDYDKMWARFVEGKNDDKLVKDLDKVVQKQKTFDPALMIQGYVALYRANDTAARAKFTQAITVNPNNRIAMYYLAELAYAHGEYARATTLYAQLLSMGPNQPVDIQTKQEKTFLLATDSLLRAAARAESENRLAEAEDYYRQALKIAPTEAALHSRLADLLSKQNKNQEAELERKAVEDLLGAHVTKPAATTQPRDALKADSLEDLGRWGSDIEVFHRIRDAETVTREQLALVIVRYFPQITELRQAPQIITDIQDSAASSEILAVVALGVMDALPNHAFEPSRPITRGELARALARLSRLIGFSGSAGSQIPAPDVAPTSAIYSDVQLVLGSGVMTLEDSGGFELSREVSGRQAVRAAERLLHSFQQVQR
jgi:tetratricopeptide (TPR) repeat protein